ANVQAGGAIYGDTITSMDVADSTFESNVSLAGGAIFTFRTNLSCERCTFRANEAKQSFNLGGQGGAIFSTFYSGVSVALTPRPFDSNVADAYSSFYGSGAGAVSFTDGPATLTRCRFTSNLSHGAQGKAGAALFAGGRVTATDCEFTGNSADGA